MVFHNLKSDISEAIEPPFASSPFIINSITNLPVLPSPEGSCLILTSPCLLSSADNIILISLVAVFPPIPALKLSKESSLVLPNSS